MHPDRHRSAVSLLTTYTVPISGNPAATAAPATRPIADRPERVRQESSRTATANTRLAGLPNGVHQRKRSRAAARASATESLLATCRIPRRRNANTAITGPLAVAFFYAVALKLFGALHPAIQALFAFALVWSLAGLFFLTRGKWSDAPEDLGISAGLCFCRRELERQRDLVRRILRWSFGPILLAIGAFILALSTVATRSRPLLPNALPFLTFVVIWIVAWFVIRFREQRALHRQIAELDSLERQNRAQ